MKLIILCGPPAVGKYTIGKKLAKKTGFSLIHIHSIYDVLEDVFGKEKYYTSLRILNNTILDIIKTASKDGIRGLIFTYAEPSKTNFNLFSKINKIVKGNNSVYYVELTCDYQTLEKRVGNKSRKEFYKTLTKSELKYLFSIKKYKYIFPNTNCMTIDTAKFPANKAVIRVNSFLQKR